MQEVHDGKADSLWRRHHHVEFVIRWAAARIGGGVGGDGGALGAVAAGRAAVDLGAGVVGAGGAQVAWDAGDDVDGLPAGACAGRAMSGEVGCESFGGGADDGPP